MYEEVPVDDREWKWRAGVKIERLPYKNKNLTYISIEGGSIQGRFFPLCTGKG